MVKFIPGQRWTSEGEPELGIGIVTEIGKDRVQIHFSSCNETRLYTLNAPLRRITFKIGDTISDTQKQTLQIEHIDEMNGLFMYRGQQRVVCESDLGDVKLTYGIEDRFTIGEVDTPVMFALRRETLMLDHRRRISPVNGFVGGRIDLIPHQLYIAHEVSTRYAPRVLLSDQVGLGKTIEACLILHRLLLSGRISRVLILVPESLVHQWFVEVLRRFNLWFHIFDEERCISLEDNAPEGNPFLDNQLIICSTAFLAGSKIRTQQALSARWDMLVVDEAHHLKWAEDKVSREYAVVEHLSKVAKGLLLLTATPEQLGVESHFARLRLLDPARYVDFDSFKNESNDHKRIACIVENLSSNKKLNDADSQLLESIFGKEKITALKKPDETVRENIIEDLLDQHGPGRVIFRNTRSAMKGFPKRKAHMNPILIPAETNQWMKQFSEEFSADLEHLETTENTLLEQDVLISGDPRIHWLVQKMEQLAPAKVLLICRSKEKVLALEKILATRVNFNVGVFHEEHTIVQRDRNAAWFAEPDGARLLLCSEIGSEGRNFQFAHHLILFDLPFHPELLEQRIGRLDRIGQKADIHIHVPYPVGSPQEVLARWYHEGLSAFEQNLEGGNKITEQFSARLMECCLAVSSPHAEELINAIINDTAIFQKQLKETLKLGHDRLLEMNSFRPKIAQELVEQIRTEDNDLGLEVYMTKVFNHFGIETEDLASRTYLLHPAPIHVEQFPSIQKTGTAITFDRTRALSREDISFLTWDHPMTINAIDLVLSSGTGGASFGILRGKGEQALLLEVLFVLETAGEQCIYIDRFLPKTPIRVVVDHNGEEVTDLYSTEILDKQLLPGHIDDLFDIELITDTIIPNMLATATEIAEVFRQIEIDKAMQRMNATLEHEISRLIYLHKKNNNIRRDEIQTALEEKITLASLIGNARIRPDAIQLIRKELK